MPIIEQQSIYTVENPSDEPFAFGHDGQQYVVPAKGSAPIPGAAIIGVLGNPEYEGQERADTIERLKAWFGNFWNEAHWEEVRPRVHVHDLDGNILPTLLTDVHTDVEMETPTLIDDRIERLERELQQLRRTSGSTLTQAASTVETPTKEVSFDDIEEDTLENASK